MAKKLKDKGKASKPSKPSKSLKNQTKPAKAEKAKPSLLAKSGMAEATKNASQEPPLVANGQLANQSPSDVLSAEAPTADEIILTDAEGRRYCRAPDCDQVGRVDGYCRYHYLLFWKKIQVRKKILSDGKLEKYVEDLTARYPDKFLEILRKDLRSEKDFMAAIGELELEEASNNNEDSDFEDDNNFIEEMRGVSADSSSIQDNDDY